MRYFHLFKPTAFVLALALCFIDTGKALAYENMLAESGAKKCASSCHDPEKIIQAKQDKLERPQCMSCHLGVPKTAHSSPFKNPLLRKIAIKGEPAHPKLKAKKAPVPQKSSDDPAVENMAFIPAGEFIMGSNERWDDEGPEHIAQTKAFYIDLYEITNSDYKIFAEATSREKPYHWPKGEIPKGKENHPVVYVNWFDALDYC